ncbi:MAG: hypothetical protein Tsb0017_25610 [Geothermobacteraceae bacterium]
MFDRPHHRLVAQVLESLHGPLLRRLGCLFGGGTAIVLQRGEYRESVDIDFLVSDADGYRQLRLLLTGKNGLAAILAPNAKPLETTREIRADQYGIRTMVQVGDKPIKFEIIREGRIHLDKPGRQDQVCGIATLSQLDLAASKLLANSDRWYDDGVFSRDLIDLAMLQLPPKLLQQAISKAETAYGDAITRDLNRAIEALRTRPDRLERCMLALGIALPRAVLWQKIRRLQKPLP